MGQCGSKAQTDEPQQPHRQPTSMHTKHQQSSGGGTTELNQRSTEPTRTSVAQPEKENISLSSVHPPSQSGNAAPSPLVHQDSNTNSTNINSNQSTITPTNNADRPLPNDLPSLKSLVQSLQQALAAKESQLTAKEKELAMVKAERVIAATGVLNQAMKIIRPANSGSARRESLSANGASTNNNQTTSTLNSTPPPSANNQMVISPSLIQLHEKQKAAAAEAAAASESSTTTSSATTSDTAPSSTSVVVGHNRVPSTSVLPTPMSLISALDDDSDSSTLRRELMDVLLAFAENELIVPNAERSYVSGSSAPSLTMAAESFSNVISTSSLDPITKQWLTAEFTRDQPSIGAGTRQRHVSVVNTRMDHSIMNASASSLYANSKLLISPDLISLSDLESWDFDPTSYNTDILIVQSFKMFESFDLLKRFSIEPAKLSNFMYELERNYIASNPYHNFIHGIDVLHCCWMFLKTSHVISQTRLRSLDIFAFMLSAVCHDLGHPGTNNHFQIATNSELAMIYNDVSILENYHCASAFRILSMQECNILQGLSREEWLDTRKIIISCILATDMSHHFEMVARLDPLFEKLERITEKKKELGLSQGANSPLSPTNTSPPSSAKKLSSMPRIPSQEKITEDNTLWTTSTTTSSQPTHSSNTSISSSSTSSTTSSVAPSTTSIAPPELTRDETIHLLNVLLHSADISNPSKPWRIAKLWSDRILAENFSQGDLERKKGLPISPFMDRSQENQSQTSINFIDFIVAPLLAAIVRAFPALIPLAENLIKNRKIWHQSLLDRISNSMRDSTGSVLVAKETERKALTNKAQIFRNCFVLPVRKIAANAAGTTDQSNTSTTTNVNEQPTTSTTSSASSSTGTSPNGHATDHPQTNDGGSIAEGEEEDDSSLLSNDIAIPSASTVATAIIATGSAATSVNASPAVTPIKRKSSSSEPNTATKDGFNLTSIVRSTSGPNMRTSPPTVPGSSSPSIVDTDPETRTLVANAADILLKSVATIVKRRHSMMEEQLRTANTLTVNNPPTSSFSQPHTPNVTAPRARKSSASIPSTGPVAGGVMSVNDFASSSSTLITPVQPRRVSLSQMLTEQMISSANIASLQPVTVNLLGDLLLDESVDGSPSASTEPSESIGSPLSPDSRALAHQLAEKIPPIPISTEAATNVATVQTHDEFVDPGVEVTTVDDPIDLTVSSSSTASSTNPEVKGKNKNKKK